MHLADYVIDIDGLPADEMALLEAECDQHTQPSGVLINKFRISETHQLNSVEKDIVALNSTNLAAFSGYSHVEDLKNIHRVLFGSLYPWAGDFRTVTLSKGDDFFLPSHRISAALESLFKGMSKNRSWTQHKGPTFHESAAHFLAILNYIHPFREGNGRTQRELLRRIYEKNELNLCWDGVGDSLMVNAMKSSREGDITPLEKILTLNHKIIPPKN